MDPLESVEKYFTIKPEEMMFYLEPGKRSFAKEFMEKFLKYGPNMIIKTFMEYFRLNAGEKDEQEYIPREDLTFDDVTLSDLVSDIKPDMVNVQSYFSRRVPLNIPIVSAAMNTVTERNMGILMALCGGIGVIHRDMTPEQHAKEVAFVKHFLHGLIKTPISFSDDTPFYDIIKRKKEKGYKFDSFPIVDAERKVIGMISGRHFDFKVNYRDRKAGDIVDPALVTLREGATVKQAYDMMLEKEVKSVPVTDENGVLRGLYVWADVQRIAEGKSSLHNLDGEGRLRCAAAVKPVYDMDTKMNFREDEAEMERIKLLVEEGIDALVIDTSHANSEAALKTIGYIKYRHGDNVDVVVGNVAYEGMMERFIESGADGVKVGIGPGSICTTREVAGVGEPQITAGYRNTRAARERIPICLDGGINKSGDISKAIAVGAHSVMLGNLLARTDESPSEVLTIGNSKVVVYRGMASKENILGGTAGRERYFMGQADESGNNIVAQGVQGWVPYEGPAAKILFQLVGGLRIGMAHCGADSIYEMHRKARLSKITPSGTKEGGVHDLTTVGATRM